MNKHVVRGHKHTTGHYVTGIFRDGPEAPMFEVFEWCSSEQDAKELVERLNEDDRFSALGNGWFPEED